MPIVLKKILFILLLAVITAIAVLGCSNSTEYTPQMELSTDIPPQKPESGTDTGVFTGTLYFVTEDGRKLSSEERLISYGRDVSRAEAVLLAMLKGPDSDALLRSLPYGIKLDKVELSSEVCSVYFTGKVPDATSWIIARAAISAAVCQAEGISAVNVFLNGMDPGYGGRALGTMSPISEALDVYMMNLRQEYETLPLQPETEAGSFESRSAALYFTNVDSTLLIARNSTITYGVHTTNEEIVELLLMKLMEGDAGSSTLESLEPVLPPDISLSRNPAIFYPNRNEAVSQTDMPTADSRDVSGQNADDCIIEVYLSESSMGYDETMMYGSITMTVSGYVPNVIGVRIFVTSEDGTMRNVSDDGGMFTRDDFSALIGHNVQIAFPDAEGNMLHAVARAMTSSLVYDPEARLKELFIGPADPGVLYPGFTGDDIDSVYVINDLAVVNWKSGFTDKLLSLATSDDSEIAGTKRDQLFVYSIVNTLTEMPGVKQVWMTENGNKLGQIKTVYLGNALIRNPGIMTVE